MTTTMLPATSPTRLGAKPGGLALSITALVFALLAFLPTALFVRHCIAFAPVLLGPDETRAGEESVGVAVLLVATLPLSALFGLVAFVLGIIAIAARRSWLGIVAIVLAPLPAVISIATYLAMSSA